MKENELIEKEKEQSKRTRFIVFIILSIMLGFIFGLAVGSTQQYNYDTKVIDPVITQRKDSHINNEGNYVSDNLFDINKRNWYSNSITIDHENNGFYGEKINGGLSDIHFELYRGGTYLTTCFYSVDTGHKQFTFDFENYNDCYLYIGQSNLGNVRFNVYDVCDTIHYTSISFDYTIENNVVRIANIMFNTSNTIDGNYIPYEPYGLIYYSQTNYNNYGDSQYISGVNAGEIKQNTMIIENMMSYLNNTVANQTLNKQSINVLNATTTELNEYGLYAYFNNSQVLDLQNQVYNSVTYPFSNEFKTYMSVSTPLDNIYIKVTDNNARMGLIGISLFGKVLDANDVWKEYYFNFWFNGTNNVVNYDSDDTSYYINVSNSSYYDIVMSKYLDRFNLKGTSILVDHVKLYTNSQTRPLKNGYRYINFITNITETNTYDYYISGYNDGVNKVLNYPLDYQSLKNLTQQYYNNGFIKGQQEGYSISKEIAPIIDMPFTFAHYALNWNVLGINIYFIFTGFMTIALVLFLVKKVLKK